jgi:hypothetical protein
VFLRKNILLALVVFKVDEAAGFTEDIFFLTFELFVILSSFIFECLLAVVQQVSSELDRCIEWSINMLNLGFPRTILAPKLYSFQKIEQMRRDSFHISS